MSVLRVVSLLMVLGTMAIAKSPQIDSFQRKSLLRDWKTVRFGVYNDMGDYAARANIVILQRLDSNQATLSIIGGGSAAEWRLPVLVAVVPEPHATKLIEQALDFCVTAQREEPAQGLVIGPAVRLSMFLEFATAFGPTENREYRYFVNFDLGRETHRQFLKFTEDAAKAPKN